ncbi:uncharacterized protein LOC134062523 [Sardina pilchardus]|uniref:uncharacterized protein LOC134062523 n=1 Tax=Sardina pilchardus TaxID=27697 RepID=UPI002E11A685
MQSDTHRDPPSNLPHNGQSVRTANGSQIPNPSMSQHHYIVASQPQLSTQHGLHFPQTGHHGDGINGTPSAKQTPVYLSVAPGSGTLNSGHNLASAGTQQCVQSQPVAMVQSQQAFLINTHQVPLHFYVLGNEGVRRGSQPQAQLNSDKTSSHSSPVSQSHQLSGSRQVQKPTMDQISGGIANHQNNSPGIVALLVKQSDLPCAANPVHILKDQRTVVSCGDDRSLQCEQEHNTNGGGTAQASSTFSRGQSGSSVLHISDSCFNGVTLANGSSLLASQSVFTTSLTSLQSTCYSYDNNVPPSTIISQGCQSKSTSSQGLSTSVSGRSSAHISTSYPHIPPPGLHGSRLTQARGALMNMLLQIRQLKTHTQRAVAVVPPILQQCTDGDERKKEKGDEQPFKILSVWSEAAENTDENSSKSGCHPSVTGIDGSDVKSSSYCKRVENEGHQIVIPFRQCVPNLSKSAGQKSDVAKHPKMNGSIVDLKSKTEEIATQPNQHVTTNSRPGQNYGPLGRFRDPVHVSFRTPIVKYSLRMLKELIADLEAEHMKQNGKSDDDSDLVQNLLDLYWGGSSSNYMTAKAEGAIENILQEATEFNMANDSVVFDGMKVEDLYQLKDRFHILKKDCDVSVSEDTFKSSSRGIKGKVGGLDKESTENHCVSETSSLLPPEHLRNTKGFDLHSDIKTMAGVSLEDPHGSPSAKTLGKATALDTNNAEHSQLPAIRLSNLHVPDNEMVTDTVSVFYSKCKNQDDCDIQEMGKAPERDHIISSKSLDFAVKLTMLSSEDTIKMFDCEKNGKMKNLSENLSSAAPSTAEESDQGCAKMKIQVLSPDEVKALSKLLYEDGTEGLCTASPDTLDVHQDETGLVSLQKGNANPDQIQAKIIDGKTLVGSGGSAAPCIFTSNKSVEGIHGHTITADKMAQTDVPDENKLSVFKKVQRSAPEEALTNKRSNAQTCGTTVPRKLSHGPTTSKKAKASVKDLARSQKRKWVEHGGEDQVTIPPPKRSNVFSPMEKSAKEKVLKNWESTFVPTNVRSRRLSTEQGTKETSFSSSEFNPRRHEKT